MRLFMFNFNHMTFLISYIACLNSTYEWYYKFSHNELEKIAQNMFRSKLCLLIDTIN